jgi:type VI secretion system protein ImpG
VAAGNHQRTLNICDLQGLDRLPIYLSGEGQTASHLFELLHAGAVASLIAAPGKMGDNPHIVTDQALVHEGLAPEQSLLPLSWNTWHGHNLLHEYFACPERFYFFALQHLAQGLRRIQGKEAEIVILLTRETQALSSLVDQNQFALYCTPIINLFDKRTDRVEVHHQETEFHLVPDKARPLDFEVFSVLSMTGQQSQSSENLEFRPLYQSLNQDEGNHGRYFTLRREARLPSQNVRKYGTRTAYIGSEVFISMVDQHEAPYSQTLRYLSLNTLLTNRDLPRLVPRNGQDDLSLIESVPVKGVGLVRPPSQPKPAYAQGELAWRLIRQLNFNYLPLQELDTRQGAQALRDMLRLYISTDDLEARRQIESLIGSRTKPVTRRLPGSGPLVYGRGILCELTVDEDGFSGISPYLFGLMLEHYLARHVSINVFTQTQLHSMQRGQVAQWPVRMGTRSTL